MRGDVQALLFEFFDLVLRLGNHHRHVGFLKEFQPAFEFRLVHWIGPGEILPQLGNGEFPVLLNLVKRANRCGFVNRNDHRLRQHTPAHEVRHDVFTDSFHTVFTGDEMVFSGEFPLQLPLLVFVQVSLFADCRNFFSQVFIRELKFRDAVLVIQRNGVHIIYRFLEVVDGNVVAKNFLRQFLTGHQGRAREPDECSVGQCVPHVGGENIVLAAVRFVGDDDDV